MDQSEPSQHRTPLADRTNTMMQGELDPNARRRQREKQRYASMSRDKKDEINRKRRERRRAQKGLADENTPNGDGTDFGQLDLHPNEWRNQRDREHYASMPREKKDELNMKRRERRLAQKGLPEETARNDEDEDEDDEWLHRGYLTQNNNLSGVSEPVHGYDGNEWLHQLQLTQNNDQTVDSRGVHVDEDSEMLHVGSLTQDNEPQDGGVILAGAETNKDDIECTNAGEDGCQMLNGTEMNGDGIECTIADGELPDGNYTLVQEGEGATEGEVNHICVQQDLDQSSEGPKA